MPQESNLNISPYFDDFDPNKGYHKVLFKPGFPIQSRELTSLQSILQNQIEQIGTHLFKEGSVVIPGQINYNNQVFAVEVEPQYLGVSIRNYAPELINRYIRGQSSNLQAKIIHSIGPEYSSRGYHTLFINYISTGINLKTVFDDGEILTLDSNITSSSINFQAGQGFAITAPIASSLIGSVVFLSEGIYFIRGNFVKVPAQTLVIDTKEQYPSCRVGLQIYEEFVSSSSDLSLTDNAKGFNNYAAPGADRLKITAVLAKKDLKSIKNENFIELLVLNRGSIQHIESATKYNELAEELARRTYSESGNYYVKPFSISARETLNNRRGNNGIFLKNQTTYSNNIPSEDLATYKISPGIAFVRGFEVNSSTVHYLDFEKTRTTKTLEDQRLNYYTGPTLSLNRVHGAPRLGFSTSSIISLRNSRIGINSAIQADKEIGVSRVYDYALESGSYSSLLKSLNEWDISLYDIQTYTDLNLNEAITLNSPTYIEGKSSGAIGHLRFNTTTGIATAYCTTGSFIKGEKLIFNGIDSNRIITSVIEYGISDIKSLYSLVGTGQTFNADTKLSKIFSIGVAAISAKSGTAPGISTVTSTFNVDFNNIIKVGDIVSFSNPLLTSSTVKSYAKISSVSSNNITISGITTVNSINDGGLPVSNINVTDFEIIGTKLKSSTDNTLYTPLPKKFISNVDLTKSSLTIKKEFNLVITASSTNIIQSDIDETFLPFDEERYVLINSIGEFEELTEDKFQFSNGGKELRIFGLSTNGSGRLIATLSKIKIKNKVKSLNKTGSIIVNKSKLSSSGIGSTTLNDGLISGNYGYGLRVQDNQICLLEPDVLKVYAVYESNNINDPVLPSLNLFNLTGPTGKVDDFIVGEEIIGNETGAVGLYIQKISSSIISLVYLNDLRFQIGESITCQSSGINGSINGFNIGDDNIINRYILDSGQKETFCDYSSLIKKQNVKPPTKKIRIIYEFASYNDSSEGDITTVSSYNQINYCDIPSIKNEQKLTDILDIRPRVRKFDQNSTSFSPFEFLSRNFLDSTNSSKNILASDESIMFNYSYYLPRIDKLFLKAEGGFQLIKGVPAETPLPPISLEDSLEVAKITLPPYICNVENIQISLNTHKRYRMQDISLLENRIKNLEYYTALSLLESKTESLLITDEIGLTRFKSGIYVDNFTTTKSQLKVGKVTNSIDPLNLELRPSHFTTSIDLLLGSKSVLGIGTTSNTISDPTLAKDIIGSNVTRTGQLLSLDYNEVLEFRQPFATRIENVTPYMVTSYTGTIELFPSSDIWVDQVRMQTLTIDVDDYTQTRLQLEATGYDPQTGLGPVRWGSWENTWTGSSSSTSSNTVQTGSNTQNNGSALVTTNQLQTTTTTTTTRTGTESRSGNRLQVSEQIDVTNEGDRVVSTSIIPFMRSRNIEFTGKTFKPYSQLYAFFDGEDVNNFIIPKLIKIRMLTGTFVVGELVTGSMSTDTITEINGSTPTITFRVAKSNHKYGQITSPDDIYIKSPYDESYTIPEEYSSSSILLNVDTKTLAQQNQSLYSGFIRSGMKLRSNSAEAEVISVELVTDSVGVVLGTFFIPNPNIPSNPSFEIGTKIFRLTSESKNKTLGGSINSSGQEAFFASGTINNMQETIRSTRKPRYSESFASENRPSTDISSTTNVRNSSVTNVTPLPPPPPPPPDPPPSPPDPPPAPVPTWPPVVPNPPPPPPPFVPDFVPDPPPPPPPIPEPEPRPPDPEPLPWVAPPEPPPEPPPDPPAPQPDPSWDLFVAIWTMQNWEDPLGQSFSIASPGGVFITSVDLYFRSKDLTLPVTVQLRPMIAGVPDIKVYPFGEVVLDASNVRISDDASQPTKFTFPSPVYLNSGTDHSIVVLSQSNEYTVWISRLGEIDIGAFSQEESRQVVVSSQPYLGSLFKSQNGSTWTPSQYEDLKFDIYSADFIQNTGTVSFYNPELGIGNNQIAKLMNDSLEFDAKKITITTTNTINVGSLVLGNTVIQKNTNASSNYVGAGGSATGTLIITNSGIGYTPSNGTSFTFNNVPVISLSGNGKNATANITIGTSNNVNGVAIAATISSGGFGYAVGDILTTSSIGNSPLGRNIQFSLSNIIGVNQLILDNVQGEFEINVANPLQFVSSSTGITTILSSSGAESIVNDIELSSLSEDGLHIKINHKNHGMHSKTNIVKISGVKGDSRLTTLTSQYNSSDSGPISIASTLGFEVFENVSVGATNQGYVLLDNEIIGYTGVLNGQLIGITRSIDNTEAFTYQNRNSIQKYENNGISLRRINKSHYLQDALVTRPIDIDSYYIRIDTSKNGVDRSTASEFTNLYINSSKSSGGDSIHATQNIQYEVINPIIQNMILPDTSITATLKGISGTSIDGNQGNQVSFLESETFEVNLSENTYLLSPNIICSRVNEIEQNLPLISNKSMELTFTLSSSNRKLSPIIDLDRVGMILISNRVDSPIQDYSNDPRTASIIEDPSAFIYANKPVELENPATSLKVILSANINIFNDIRLFYSITNDISTNLIYYPFPGYDNIDINKNVIDISKNDGRSDKRHPKSDVLSSDPTKLVYVDYEFTCNLLPEFKYFSIKIIGSSTNQAYPPIIKDLRVIALA